MDTKQIARNLLNSDFVKRVEEESKELAERQAHLGRRFYFGRETEDNDSPEEKLN